MGYYDNVAFEPDTSIGYLVRRLHQAQQAVLERVFAAEGLTMTQWTALVSIHFERGSTCAELARDLAHDKGAMTRMVDALEKRGWVTRSPHPDDRRVVNLALTDEGEAVTRRCRAHVAACWNDWLSDWPTQDVDAMIRGLHRLRLTLEEAQAAGGCA